MAGGIIAAVLTILVIGAVLSIVAFLAYRRVLRRAKAIERGLKMVPLLIHLPSSSADTAAGGRDQREVMREKVSQAATLYDLIVGTAQQGFKSRFYGQRHIALELEASGGIIHYFAAVPVGLESVVQQAIVTAYPGAKVEEAEDYNIFNASGRVAGVAGGELVLKEESSYPIATIDQLERDPMDAIINVLSQLQAGEGAAVQIMLRPASHVWNKRSADLAKVKRQKGDTSLAFTPMDLAKAAVKGPTPIKPGEEKQLTGIEEQQVKGIENKAQHAGFEVLIRVITSTASPTRSQTVARDLVTAFALFEATGSNGFKYLPAADMDGLITAFIFRFFPPELNRNVLNSQELATLFHLPDAQFTSTAQVERQASKEVDAPPSLPAAGLLVGYNQFRGVNREVRLTPEDRRRHTYIVGQTGTGKSTMLENLAVQDMLAGGGFAFIDPHGDTAERLLGMVPKHRAEDVIYFNPADTEYPLGLNLFEFTAPEQKDFIIQETIGMLYKLYDPGHTGIIGPRYEHWFRNAALTLMSDPVGATFIEVPKVFTDSNFLKQKFRYVSDPTVVDFWSKEMAQTSDYHKSEMLGWFVSKFGAFQSNEMMRNIIGQPKSAFDLREVMDNRKILIVNLSKGRIGELNSQLLGMIFVIKFQAAAMSRAQVPEEQRPDFCLYVDEFQNFSTDSFASILSEARKYRLNLIVANQFIGQLSDQIRDAVFGNVGTIASYRAGPDDAEFLTKQFAPAFDARDIVGLPNYHAILRLMVGGLPSQPFSLTALSPLGMMNPELALAVKQLSAAKFGRTRVQVEADIFGRLSGTSAAREPEAGGAPAAPAAVSLPVAQPTAAPATVAPTAAAPTVQPAVAMAAPAVTEVTPAPALPVTTSEAPLSTSTSMPAQESLTPAAIPPVTSTAAQPTSAADLSNVLNSGVDKPAPPPPAGNTLSISDIVKDQPAVPAPTAPVQPQPAAIQTFHKPDPITPVAPAAVPSATANPPAVAPSEAAPPAPSAPPPVTPPATDGQPAQPIQAPPKPQAEAAVTSHFPTPQPQVKEPTVSSQQPAKPKLELKPVHKSKTDEEIEQEIAAAGLGATIKIVDSAQQEVAGRLPSYPTAATLQGIIPVTPQPTPPPAPTPVPTEAAKTALPPFVRPLSQPGGQITQPAPAPQPAIAANVSAPPIPLPDLAKAGSAPVLSGQKPQSDPGEIFVDEQGNVHMPSD